MVWTGLFGFVVWNGRRGSWRLSGCTLAELCCAELGRTGQANEQRTEGRVGARGWLLFGLEELLTKELQLFFIYWLLFFPYIETGINLFYLLPSLKCYHKYTMW